MKPKFLPQAVMLCSVLIAFLCGCAPTVEEDPTSLLLRKYSADQLYCNAITDAANTDTFSLRIASEKELVTNTQVFQEILTQAITCSDYASDSPQIYAEQTYSYADEAFDCILQYTGGTGYLALNGSAFSQKMHHAIFLEKLFPFSFLDPSLYNAVEARQIGSRIKIGFYNALKPERWAAPDGASFHNAYGTVLLDANGQFLEGTYHITYSHFSYVITQEYTIEYTAQCSPVTNLSDHFLNSTPIHQLFAPLALEKSCSYLTTASAVSSETTSTIDCQLSGLNRIQTTKMELNAADSVYACIDTNIEVTDVTRLGEIRTQQQMETYKDGIYTIQSENSTTSQNDITDDLIMQYCRNLLVKHIPMLYHLKNVVALHHGQTIQMTFDVTEDFTQAICGATCESLYQDSALSTLYETSTMRCSLEIDLVTGFPVSMSIYYEGNYTAEDASYGLISEITQYYHIS